MTQQIVSINPADGSVAGHVFAHSPRGLDALVARAADAARNTDWRSLLPNRRAIILHAIAGRIAAERQTLAGLQMADNGKPIAECLAMADSAAAAFRYYASVCETLETSVTSPRGDYLSLTVLEPYGVVLAITPWNSPLMNEAQKAAPALAAGNAVILKPSEDTPLLAPELVRICLEAGLPEGLIQVAQGLGQDVGAALVAHPGVRMISFTGGTQTGRAIATAAGRRLVPVALELGGKSPHIVFGDANIEHAVAAVVAGIFGSAGQSCVAGSRLLVEHTVYDEVVSRVVARAKSIRVGLPSEPGIQMGPLASFHHRERVQRYVDIARTEGGRFHCGGEAPAGAPFDKGAFFLPTVIDGLPPTARVAQEEIFGPVLVALPFKDEADLIEQANGTAFGLACGIWTEDFKKAWRTGRALDAGSVWINTYKQSVTTTPFGGFKDSGFGREKGVDGLRLYGQVKSVFFGLHEKPMTLEHVR